MTTITNFENSLAQGILVQLTMVKAINALLRHCPDAQQMLSVLERETLQAWAIQLEQPEDPQNVPWPVESLARDSPNVPWPVESLARDSPKEIAELFAMLQRFRDELDELDGFDPWPTLLVLAGWHRAIDDAIDQIKSSSTDPPESGNDGSVG